MKTTYFPNETRGSADYGWLQAKYSFSFGNYYDANRGQFGKLRVLNDDIIAPDMGFGTHPHNNMEIVSIPLSGSLAHKDSMNHEEIIKTGDVQVMSAGTGVTHSEYNPNKNESTNLLQIWLFPDKTNVTPRYDQKSYTLSDEKNQFLTVVAPENKEEGALWIHQDAYFNLATLDENKAVEYSLRNPNHLSYLFVIEGTVTVGDKILNTKDALGVSDTDVIAITATTDARILLIETPE